MRKVFAWLGAATLFMVMSRAEAANDVLKPYVVLILDTSGSMAAATGAGPTSCGKRDTRINHAVCAINSIVNSYGEMVFSLGRFRETTGGPAGITTCDMNGNQEGNQADTLPTPTGGDNCNTEGFYCGDCDPTTGTTRTCESNAGCTQGVGCLNIASEAPGGCADDLDNDSDGRVNDGCPLVSGTGESGQQCFNNVDDDGDNAINDGCLQQGTCNATYSCKNGDSGFEVLTPLVDGNNDDAALFTDGSCNVCGVGTIVGVNPEIWGVSQNTYTPLSSSLQGAQHYWEGRPTTTDGTNLEIWAANKAGFDPINRDPSAHVFLTINDATGCNANPTSCQQFVGESACGDTVDSDGDLRINDGCPAAGPGNTPEVSCADNETICTGAANEDADSNDTSINDGCPTVGSPEGGSQCTPGNALDEDNDGFVNDGCPVVGNDNDGDGFMNDGCMAWCNGPTCCCATQCRPYITILLTDGDETCTTPANTLVSAADLRQVTPLSDAVTISTLVRAGGVSTITTAVNHPFKAGDQVSISGTGVGNFGGFQIVLASPAPTATTFAYSQSALGANSITNTGNVFTFANAGHTASSFQYDIQVKPIGFGIPVGYQPIEDIAHAGGAPDVAGVNEGYYAQDEADLELAISQILADSVRAERCNDRDDDCDVRIDEDFPTKGNVCTVGVGECIRSGTLICQPSGLLGCSVAPGSAVAEICNLKDDDCDGFVDETIEHGDECGPALIGGVANPLNTTDDDVTDGVINDGCPAVGPAETNCNGSNDDDSDGYVNDGCPGVGSCSVCIPTAEICDNADNNCDGVVDRTCTCTSGPNIGQTCRPTNGTTVNNIDCGGGSCPAASSCTPITRSCGIGVCPGIETCTGPNTYTGCTAFQDEPIETKCDGIDNDCDGVCDGFSRSCSEQNGACNPTLTNSCPGTDSLGDPSQWPTPDVPESGTACAQGNAIDEDKDGRINDGCPADGAAESGNNCLNATDDDGDMDINDGCLVPTLPIAENICRAGTRTCALKANCAPGNQFGGCSGETLPCGPDSANCDICNGQDDDCDNKIDEDFVDADCSTNCGIGRTVCVNGAITCNSTAATSDPTCDNIDDDCDGKFDENWVAPMATCGTPALGCDPSPTCVSNLLADNCCVCNGVPKCRLGDEICDGGPINEEICNCLDDDCDGTIDENANPTTDPICPGGGTCVACQCAFGCAEGEFPCPLGKKCDTSDRCNAASDNPGIVCAMTSDCPNGACEDAEFCVNDPCFNVSCATTPPAPVQTCVPKTGFPNEAMCVDTCALINDADNTAPWTQCPGGFVCVPSLGECKKDDCTTFPERCGTGESCVVDSNTGFGSCVSNPCATVTCSGAQYCVGGECVSSCADVTCPTGQRCRMGMCETDPCGQPCPFGQACNDTSGECIEDPCKFRDCPTGQWCNPNANVCENDPCVTSNVTCPNPGEVCRGGSCIDPDTLLVDAAGESHVTVGGGGGCNTGGGNGLLLVLGALGLLVSRRRRSQAGGVL